MAASPPTSALIVRAGLLTLSLCLAAASAQARPSPPPSPPSPPLPPARVIVTGEGSVKVAPDYAVVTGGVSSQAKTAKEATEADSKLMTAVDAALIKAGIAQKDIQTSQFSVRPIYAPGQPSVTPMLTGFEASNQISVTVRQIDQVGDILDQMIAAGANNVGNVSLLHADVSKALDPAREAAVADARRKAELYAKAAGLTLGAVAWITEQPAYAPPPGAPRMLAFSRAAAVPISAGEDTLQVQITVGFEVAH